MNIESPKGNDITVKLNNYTLCYDDNGEGKTPVIFIHGFPFDKSSWQPQSDFLKKANRVITYDIRGFGKSTSGAERESIRLFADDLINFMDYLKIEKAIVCGLSMGGYILLNAVHHYPDRFKAIILSDTQCIGDSPETKEKRNQSIAKIASGGLTEFAEGFVKNIFCKKSQETKNDIVEKIKNTILSTSTNSITGALSALAQRPDVCFSLKEIRIPALIIYGKEDAIIPATQIELLHNNILQSKIFEIADAGHLPNLEQPDEFNKILSEFISGL